MEKNQILELYQLTIDLWQDIADNSYTDKCQSKYYDKVKDFLGSCPLCKIGCNNCPLYINNVGCMEQGHPFRSWLDGVDVKGNAQKIVDLVKKGMEKLGSYANN